MTTKYLIKDKETEKYLLHIYLGKLKGVDSLMWTDNPEKALQYDTDEEARAVINFVLNVVNWELEGYLTIYKGEE